MRDTADRLVSLGLQDAGYVYVNTDDCWLEHDRRADGRLQPAKNFPGGDEGMRNLSNYIHKRGLLLGIYGAAGQTTCAGRAGGLYHEQEDAQLYADWGVDYLKYDDCGEVNLQSYAKFQAMRNALNKTGRPMVYSYEPHVTVPISWPTYIGNAWRTGHDIGSKYESMFSDLTINNAWANVGGPGSWNDADMLEVGNPGLSVPEARSHFSLWCLIKSPLLIGSDLTKISKDYLDILKNKEVIAISQDTLGHQGRLVDAQAGPSSYELPALTQLALSRMPPSRLSVKESESYAARLRDSFEGVTDCQFAGAAEVTKEQQWLLTADGAIQQGGNCLTAADDGSVSMVVCSNASAQKWSGLETTRVTVAQIVHEPIAQQTEPGTIYWNGPIQGLPMPGQGNRRCGTCCGAKDTESAMCSNTTYDGKLYVKEEEIRKRCAADSSCVGYALDTTEGGYFRPVTKISSIDGSDSKWKTWEKSTTPPTPPPKGKLCLATDGTKLFTETCLDEPAECSSKRCANSVRVRQLWFTTQEGQLISSFTDHHIPPVPLASRDAPGLINVPKCLATGPNANPPQPPVPPPSVRASLPLQVWAGKLSGGRVAVILVNADKSTAKVTANWEDVFLKKGTSVHVRDAVTHKDLGNAVDSVSANVPSHDVAVLVLTPGAERIEDFLV